MVKWGVFGPSNPSKSQIPSFALNILNRSQTWWAWWAWWEHVTTEQSRFLERSVLVGAFCLCSHSVGGQLRFRFPATRQNGHWETWWNVIVKPSRHVVESWLLLSFDLIFLIWLFTSHNPMTKLFTSSPTVRSGNLQLVSLLSLLMIPLVMCMVHVTRRNYGEKTQLMDDLKSFDLAAWHNPNSQTVWTFMTHLWLFKRF